MKAWFIRFWTDEARFVALVRGLIAMAGAMAPLIPGIPDEVAPIIIAAALFFNAGEKNESVGTLTTKVANKLEDREQDKIEEMRELAETRR